MHSGTINLQLTFETFSILNLLSNGIDSDYFKTHTRYNQTVCIVDLYQSIYVEFHHHYVKLNPGSYRFKISVSGVVIENTSGANQINRLRFHCSLVSISIIICSRSLFFNLINLLPSDIPLSIGDTYYLYLSTSAAHTTVLVMSSLCWLL